MRHLWLLGTAALSLGACSTRGNAPSSDSVAATASPAPTADADRPAAGGSLPAGYIARTDQPSAKISDARYVADNNEWDVTTGPAHILYSSKDIGNGNYTASATIRQLEAPAHPEAYGIFIGGRDLDKPAQTYTYFLVRGTGELAIKVREGDKTRDVVKWTPSPDVPKADASGKASYALAAQVTNDAVRFSVNGKQVASVSRTGLPTDGVAGLRVNHNLHVKVSPVAIKAP